MASSQTRRGRIKTLPKLYKIDKCHLDQVSRADLAITILSPIDAS